MALNVGADNNAVNANNSDDVNNSGGANKVVGGHMADTLTVMTAKETR
jgi:hypothetical protein